MDVKETPFVLIARVKVKPGEVENYLKSGDLPHLLLFGKAGTGKTTLAKIITKNIDCDYLYINASDENNVDNVRNKIKTFASSIGFKPLKVVILDEADFLTPNAQAALRNLMETFSKHCRFILTCNYVERIIDPIQSRCQSYKVVPPSKKEVAQQLVDILDDQMCTYELDDVALIVNAGYPDIRRVINSAQRQVVDGNLKIDVSSIIQNDYKIQLLETENNMKILETLIPEISDYRSRLVLYNYDSFLFDFDYKEDGMEFLNKVKTILESNGKFPTKVSMGDNYHKMKDITGKLND